MHSRDTGTLLRTTGTSARSARADSGVLGAGAGTNRQGDVREIRPHRVDGRLKPIHASAEGFDLPLDRVESSLGVPCEEDADGRDDRGADERVDDLHLPTPSGGRPSAEAYHRAATPLSSGRDQAPRVRLRDGPGRLLPVRDP